MSSLSDEEGWELFRRAAFGGQPLSEEMRDYIYQNFYIQYSFELPSDIYHMSIQMQHGKYRAKLSKSIDAHKEKSENAEILVYVIAMSIWVCFFLHWQWLGLEKMTDCFSLLFTVFVVTVTFASLPRMNATPETEKWISSKEKNQLAALEETSDVLEEVSNVYAEIPEFHGVDTLLDWKPQYEGLATCNENFGETANQEIEYRLSSGMKMTLKEKLHEEVGCSIWYEGSDDTDVQNYESPLSKQEAEQNANISDEDTDALLLDRTKALVP